MSTLTAIELRKKYKGLVQWCKEIESYDYYIDDQVYEAYKDKAPEDALYKNRDGKWRCVSDLDETHPFRATYANLQ